EHAVDHHHKPHESPWVMVVPLLVLAIGAVAAGFVFYGQFVGHHEAEFWRGAIHVAATNHVLHDSHEVPTWVKWAPLLVTAIGTAIAVYVYLMRAGLARRMAERGGPLYSFLYNKWYFDEIYDAIFVRGARALGDLFWKVGDIRLIDGLGPNGAAWASLRSAARLAKIQSGFVYHYAFVMLLGVAVLHAFASAPWGALVQGLPSGHRHLPAAGRRVGHPGHAPADQGRGGVRSGPLDRPGHDPRDPGRRGGAGRGLRPVAGRLPVRRICPVVRRRRLSPGRGRHLGAV